MVMSDSHKQKISSGVKNYHACAKSHGCGKSQLQPKNTKPKKEKNNIQKNIKKNKTEKKVEKILAIENIKKQTAPKKVVSKFTVNQNKRRQANNETIIQKISTSNIRCKSKCISRRNKKSI